MLSLELALDRRPLTAPPEMPLSAAITMMGKAESSCVLPHLVPLNIVLLNAARASAIAVVAGSEFCGILTETDVIRAIAAGRDLASTPIAEVMQPAVIALTQTEPPQDIFVALDRLRQIKTHHLPILNPQGQLLGMVTYESIRQALPLDQLLKAYPLSQALFPTVITAAVTDSLLSLATQMAEAQVSHVLLLEGNPQAQPVGFVTQRDILLMQALEMDLSQLQGRAVITSPFITFPLTESILAATWQMQQQRVSTVAVMNSTPEPLGIFTHIQPLQTLELAQMQHTVAALQQSIANFAASPQPAETQVDKDDAARLQEQLESNRLLTVMALRIRESLNLHEILTTAVAEVRQFLQTDRVIIYQFNPDMSGKVVVESLVEGWEPALNKTVEDSCFGQNYAHEYKAGRIQVTEDIYTAGLTQCHIDILVLFDIRACLVVPIMQGTHLWGLLCAYHCSGPRKWRQLEIDLLQQLATHMAIAIQQSELYQQVQAELRERERAETQIKVSLQEKEILLKEIHHRVKNNLQIISSLLKLQSAYIKDAQALEMFKDSQSRIRSMAIIHEKLYQSQNLSTISFTDYLRDLGKNLLRSYNSAQRVNLDIDCNEIRLDIDTAVPCGLIVNELVSNALKHAFPQRDQGNEIRIKLYTKGTELTLMVGDNGIGFPQNLDFRQTESLGLELVCTLTEQLLGTIELERQTGTTFKIVFPKKRV